ncbi:hypothetical protein [Pseudomonas anguilliseptica]|nr:hypothetical protein [Pseudomonas anguilliseptica]
MTGNTGLLQTIPKPFRWSKTAESIISSVHRAKLAVIRNELLD